MYQYSNSLIRQFPSGVTGNAAVGVQATVYVGETGALSSLFEVNGSPKSNPVTTDSKGFYSFSLADGDYRIVFSSSQFATLRISVLDGAQIREDFEDLVASNEQFKDQQQNNYNSFTASQQAAYDAFVLSQGWDQVGTFAAGFTYTSPNQVGQDVDGNWWRWNGALPKAVTAGTLPSSDANYKLVGDGVLRSDLANGTADIGGVAASEIQKLNDGNISPVMIEQFINGFGGRGMLAGEFPSIATEQFILSSQDAGDTSLSVADTSQYQIGARVMIHHSSVGLYIPYFINTKTSGSIGFSSPLLYPVDSTCKVERLWYNQPHPGKFYMRHLAQKIARLPEFEHATPLNGRLYFSQFDSNPTDENDTATAVNGAGVSYVNEVNISQGVLSAPLESSIGRALFITVDADGEGADLPEFRTYGVTSAVLRVCIMCRNPSVSVLVQLIDDESFVQSELVIDSNKIRNANIYTLPIKLSGRTAKLKTRILALSGVTGSTAIIVDQLEVFESSVSMLPAIPKGKRVTIVGLGDSWIAGDTGTTAERESILTQLQIELPSATIINAGIGGQKVWQMYERFETDVAVHNPDYVIVNTGTNDCYSPISGTFFPNSVDQYERYYNLLISKIMAIGAKPVIIGTPALAESDSGSGFADWALNDRAKTYSRYFYKRLSQVVDYETETPAPVVPTVANWTPVLSIGGSTTGITYTTQSGKYVNNGVKGVQFSLEITLSSKGAQTGVVTISMPPISSITGVVQPMATLCANVVSALGAVAVLNVSASNTLRMQIPSSTGNTTMTDANLANNSTIWVSGIYLTSS